MKTPLLRSANERTETAGSGEQANETANQGAGLDGLQVTRSRYARSVMFLYGMPTYAYIYLYKKGRRFSAGQGQGLDPEGRGVWLSRGLCRVPIAQKRALAQGCWGGHQCRALSLILPSIFIVA